MAKTTASLLTPEEFRAECNKRLMDTFEVMIHLGLRSRESVWARVRNGTLPEPVMVKRQNVSLWDRQTIPTEKEA